MRVTHHAARAAAVLVLAAPAFVAGASARPMMPAEERGYWGETPPCDSWWTLKQIAWSFNDHEPEFGSRLEIEDIDGIREIGFRTDGRDLIPRRYCSARARFNDGRVREVKYNLSESGGFAGVGSGVEWCVVGLDRNHVYSPACSAAGP